MPPVRERHEVEVYHPNRDRAVVQATRLVVVALLLATIALMAIISFAGWPALQGAKPEAIVLILVYLLLTVFALRWNRGILPLSAALGVILLIFAAVSAPGWFARDKSGFTQPHLSANLLGVLTLIMIPLQLVLIAFTMRAFGHGWNVEEERPVGGSRRGGEPASGQPATA